MKDSMKPCQHTLSEDVTYKEVVIIGNGPSGMVTSFMLDGNVPYLKEIPEHLPIDDMLKARLSNLPPGQSLYDSELSELAEGMEGRSQNPIPLLMDNLLRPCADLGIQADSLIEWKFEVDKQIEHVVLGRGPPGGAWHTFPPAVRTLSPAAWLTLPPHAGAGAPAPAGTPAPVPAGARLPARAVANYCRRYVHACKLQRYFRTGVIVTSVTRVAPPAAEGPRCLYNNCPLNASFCVSGYDKACGRAFRYLCSRVVLGSGGGGGGERPRALAPRLARHALHALADWERAVHALHSPLSGSGAAASVLVVGSGVSAADAVLLARRGGLRARHLHRAPADALARLPPQLYPDYCQVYKMMCDGPSGNHDNYTPYPEHIIVDIQPLTDKDIPLKMADDIEDDALRLKRVTLLNLVTNSITEITVSLIGVFIGSRPDLFFLQTNFNLNCIDMKTDCACDTKIAQRKMEEKQCFLKNHWHYLKSVLGQSIQSCKSRYLNYTEINGNTGEKCVIDDCNKSIEKDCTCKLAPYEVQKCQCDNNPYSDGIGYGIDVNKPVDCRSNPIAIDKSTHEVLHGPKGIYALGPLTADNFIRFIPGGALAIVAKIHKDKKI